MSIKILGHRGSGRTDKNPFAQNKPPQHTLLSFQHAFETEDADGVEFDIFMSKDGVPVIIHRQGAKDLNIADMTLAQIQAIPLPAGQRIPTLEETLIFLAQMQERNPRKKMLINAELKGPGVVADTVRIVDDVARRYPLDPSAIFYDALEWERLSEMRSLDAKANIMPALSTARLFNLTAANQQPGAYDRSTFTELADFLHEQKCCGIDVMTADIRPEMIALARKLDVGFCSYPQGPHPKKIVPLIHANIGLLEEFSRTSRQAIMFKVEDIAAARELIADRIEGRTACVDTIERLMGMHLS